MPWVQLVRLSLMADDMNEQRRKQQQEAQMAARRR